MLRLLDPKSFLAVVACASAACGGQTRITLAEGLPDEDGAAPILDMIDDMEDGDERLPIPFRDGRSGSWATYNDGIPPVMQWPVANTFIPMSAISPPRGSSTYAARTFGEGLQQNGWANLELALTANIGYPDLDAGKRSADAGLPPGLYDASRFKGITFYARVGEGTQQQVLVAISTMQTLPQGGVCCVACSKCYDSFSRTLTFGTEWKQIFLAFDALAQRGFGDPLPYFDAAHVYTIAFGFSGTIPFDLWIDDIAFYR